VIHTGVAARTVEEAGHHNLAGEEERRNPAVEVGSLEEDMVVAEEDILFQLVSSSYFQLHLLYTYDLAEERENGSPAAGGIAVEVVARNLLAVGMDSEGDILCANWSVQLFVSPQIVNLRPGGGAP
jgi:hypothetical protein